MDFSTKLLKWYQDHKRDLPWRGSRDPYTVWLSEIILQQTRVAQGMPYFLSFKASFPTVQDLAMADEEEVLKLWQGLGYYSRARNLHQTARTVAFDLEGDFPTTYKGLLALKGIGPYTAAAISSICFDEAQPVVDGNVYRVLSRYFGIDLPVNTSKGQRAFRELAEQVLLRSVPGEFNQAIMEFGALQCVPKSPDCLNCPLNSSCAALAQDRVGELPRKQPKAGPRRRFFHYIMPVDPNFNTLLIRREGRGIWQGLYEFPLLEQEDIPSEATLANGLGELLDIAEPKVLRTHRFNSEPVVHKLSHQHLFTTFWILYVDALPERRVPLSEMEKYPVPVLISEFMDTVKNSYF